MNGWGCEVHLELHIYLYVIGNWRLVLAILYRLMLGEVVALLVEKGTTLVTRNKTSVENLENLAIVFVTIDSDNCSLFAYNEFYPLLHLCYLISK